MNDKLLKKIFPKDNCSNIKNLKYDNEGLWSISYPDLAENLSKNIKIFDNESFKLNTIIDATAGIGGNVLSFAKYFENVYCIEIDDTRFDYLKSNVSNYTYKNIKCIKGNSIEIIKTFDGISHTPDVIFFDPPWGGPSYKYVKDIDIELSNLDFYEILKIIYNSYKVKLVVLKFPFNYKFLELINKCEQFIKQFNIVKDKNVVFLFLKMNLISSNIK